MTDWSPVVVAMAAVLMAVAAGIPGLLAWMQGRASHRLMNSRMSELVKLTRKAALARGKIEGRAQERKKMDADKGRKG